jgi:hypothetical protein
MAKQKKKGPGPVSSFTDELANRICEQIADGTSLIKICKAEGMPNKSTVLRWLEDKPEFATKYARARELMADHHFDLMQDIADEATPETVQTAKLRLETMRWRVSKLLPKKYGEKVETAHTGAVEVRHLQVNVMPAAMPVRSPTNAPGNGQ